jgi:hypothetical protein
VLAWADGYEEATGNRPVAARCRTLARDLLELLVEYEGERSAREAMQQNYQRALAVITKRTSDVPHFDGRLR